MSDQKLLKTNDGRSEITNKHYKEKPALEFVHKLFTYLSVDFLQFLGGNFIPMQWVINA